METTELSFQVQDLISPWIVATCSTFGSTEYAIKIAPFNKNKKKNQASFMINHEQTFYRIRFLAFQKDHDGLVSIVQVMIRDTPFP